MPHRDRDPAQRLDQAKARLVGQIVSHDHRDSSGKRRLLDEFFDGRGLSEFLGLDLQHHLAFLDVVGGCERTHERGYGLSRGRLEFGSEPEMHGERAPLVLEQRAGMRLDECGQCETRGGERRVAEVRTATLAGGAATLDAVQACRRARWRCS